MKILLTTFYTLGIFLISRYAPKEALDYFAGPLFYVLLPFAILRMTRTISYSSMLDWFRKPFTHIEPDSSGAGDNVHANKGNYFGELIECVICTGSWVTLVLVGLFTANRNLGVSAVIVFGFAGVHELLNSVTELFQWQARLARENSGYVGRINKSHSEVNHEDNH